MESPTASTRKSLETGRSNILAFAVTVGLLIFFVTGELDGGLTGFQGFFVGATSVILLFVLLGLVESLQKKSVAVRKESVRLPGHLLVTQSESKGGISIEIHLGRELLTRIERND